MKSSLSTKKAKAKKKEDRKPHVRYCYCVVPASNQVSVGDREDLQIFPISGVDEKKIYAITHRKYMVIVSDSAEKEHEILDSGVSHQKVVEAVWDESQLLPMGFGQVATEREIRTFLERKQYRFKMLFNKYGGTKQLCVKAFWDMEMILKDIGTTDDQIRIMRKQIESKPDVVAHKMKMKMGQKIADDLETRGKRVSSDILRRLSGLSRQHKKNKNLNEEMFFNGVFLLPDYMVNNEGEDKFDAAVDELDTEFGSEVNLKYMVSAPYDFIALKIK